MTNNSEFVCNNSIKLPYNFEGLSFGDEMQRFKFTQFAGLPKSSNNDVCNVSKGRNVLLLLMKYDYDRNIIKKCIGTHEYCQLGLVCSELRSMMSLSNSPWSSDRADSIFTCNQPTAFSDQFQSRNETKFLDNFRNSKETKSETDRQDVAFSTKVRAISTKLEEISRLEARLTKVKQSADSFDIACSLLPNGPSETAQRITKPVDSDQLLSFFSAASPSTLNSISKSSYWRLLLQVADSEKNSTPFSNILNSLELLSRLSSINHIFDMNLTGFSLYDQSLVKLFNRNEDLERIKNRLKSQIQVVSSYNPPNPLMFSSSLSESTDTPIEWKGIAEKAKLQHEIRSNLLRTCINEDKSSYLDSRLHPLPPNVENQRLLRIGDEWLNYENGNMAHRTIIQSYNTYQQHLDDVMSNPHEISQSSSDESVVSLTRAVMSRMCAATTKHLAGKYGTLDTHENNEDGTLKPINSHPLLSDVRERIQSLESNLRALHFEKKEIEVEMINRSNMLTSLARAQFKMIDERNKKQFLDEEKEIDKCKRCIYLLNHLREDIEETQEFVLKQNLQSNSSRHERPKSANAVMTRQSYVKKVVPLVVEIVAEKESEIASTTPLKSANTSPRSVSPRNSQSHNLVSNNDRVKSPTKAPSRAVLASENENDKKKVYKVSLLKKKNKNV